MEEGPERSNAERRAARTRTTAGEEGVEAWADSRRALGEGAEGRPGGWRGGPAVLSSSRPTASAGRQRTRAALSDPPLPQPGRVSRIFRWGKPAGGSGARPRLRPRPWKRQEEEGWCIGEAKVSPFCSAVGGSRGRRRVSAFRRVPAGSGGGGGGPATPGWGGCGPRDARGGGGADWGRGGGASGPAPAG